MSRRITLLIALALLAGAPAWGGSLSPGLAERLEKASPDEKIGVIVHLKGDPDPSVFPTGHRQAMVRYLKAFCEESQRGFLGELPRYGEKVAQVRPFWICNAVAMQSSREVILELSRRSDVGVIETDQTIRLDPIVDVREEPAVLTTGWNISRIQAPQAWALGYQGQGIIVGNLDTGVRTTHVTFNTRYRGYWKDAVNDSLDPYDDHGHGTHTMGTICGGNTADTIGVARLATFVAAKAFDAGGGGSTKNILTCYQWFADLGPNAPQVVGNSWGMSWSGNTSFWAASRNLQVLGTHQVYSMGNDGPYPRTGLAPATYPHLIGVGATAQYQDTLAIWSSRGPSVDFGALETSALYLNPDWLPDRIKPDLTAPGVNVRSSYHTSDYAYVYGGGTSMASPHVTGAVALMLEKNPALTDRQIWQILTATCDTPDAGRPYPNQNYGWGRLNVYRAVLMTPPSGVETEKTVFRPEAPVAFVLHPAQPNPFARQTVLRYALPVDVKATLRIYNSAGQVIRTLTDRQETGGVKTVTWDGRNEAGEGVPSGVYLCRLAAGRFAETRKLVVLR